MEATVKRLKPEKWNAQIAALQTARLAKEKKPEMDGFELRAVRLAQAYSKFCNALTLANYIDKDGGFMELYKIFCIVEAIDELGNR